MHLRASGPPVDRVRTLGPAEWLTGRSAHSVDELQNAAPPDYFVFGTIFGSETKGPGAPVQGIPGLAAAASATDIPLLAIGGMTPDRAAQCIAAGAAGIAAIGAFLPPGRSPGAMGIMAAAGAFHAAMAPTSDERRG